MKEEYLKFTRQNGGIEIYVKKESIVAFSQAFDKSDLTILYIADFSKGSAVVVNQTFNEVKEMLSVDQKGWPSAV